MSNTPPETIDADIAAFLAEGHSPEEEEAPAQSDNAAAEATEGEPEAEVQETEADASEDVAEPEAPAAPIYEVDTEALTKALQDEDPVAFVKALGEKADKFLSGKAHKALRIKVKEAEDITRKANEAQTTAEDYATKLLEKFADPIAARKAANEGDVNAFLDMIEKWAGADFNTVQRWVANGIAGRPARLEAKAREESTTKIQEQAKQDQAREEARTWVATGLSKIDPVLAKEMPEVVDLVYEEIRQGFNAGITTPAKALPLAKKKLEAQYQKLQKLFGQPSKGKKPATPSPAVKASKAVGNSTKKELTLDEEIALFKRENNLR